MDLFRKHIEKFSSLSDDEFNYISSYFKVNKFKKNEVIIDNGQFNTQKYFVLSGLLKSYFLDRSGNEYVLQFAEPESWILDLESFYNNSSSSLIIDCITDVEALSISHKDFITLNKEVPIMSDLFCNQRVSRFIQQQNRLKAKLKLNSTERFYYFIKTHPNIFKKIPMKTIASYIGVRRETLSRNINTPVSILE